MADTVRWSEMQETFYWVGAQVAEASSVEERHERGEIPPHRRSVQPIGMSIPVLVSNGPLTAKLTPAGLSCPLPDVPHRGLEAALGQW
jgi:hypothetical protein